MLGSLLSDLLPWLAGAAAAVIALLGYGRAQKARGRSQARSEALTDSLERQEEGRDAVSDLRDADRDTLADRVRKNDGRW